MKVSAMCFNLIYFIFADIPSFCSYSLITCRSYEVHMASIHLAQIWGEGGELKFGLFPLIC